MKNKNVLFSFISFSYKCHKPYYFVMGFYCLVKALETLFNAYSLSFLLSYLEKGEYKPCLIVGGIIVGINFCFYFLNKLLTRIKEVSSMKLELNINKKIYDKLMNLPFQYLEDPYYLDLKERAKMGINNFSAIYRIVTNMADFLQNLASLIGLLSLIALFDYKIVIVLLVSLILNLLIIFVNMKTKIKFFNELVPINRKFGVYLDALFDENKGKDYRNYPLGTLMENRYAEFENKTIGLFVKLSKRMAVFEDGLSNLLNYVQMCLVYILVAVKTIVSKLPISTFSLYVNAAISFSQVITKSINNAFEITQCLQYVLPVLELMDIQSEDNNNQKIELNGNISSIEFKNVSFTYPKSDIVILDNISFKIHKGEKISIVGLNGAGKTTLVKLICRLYKPTSGEIYINDININDYDYNSYIKNISAVFQDFKLFAYSLKENILNEDGDELEAYQIACKVGLKEKIDSLEKGINTLYSKSFDDGGIELSGGESQKVAIARALHSNSSLVILDEPTSALDPLSEADIYQNFNNLVKEKTALYISHRMSSSVFCDRIIVLNNGKIEAFDSHMNLMKNEDSLYYKLFMAQAKNYSE